ncbi:hypothetical protein [Streptomyces panaciradicis]|uniref:hypothetical protein n=1 Tax=Streptomyces panaciradicis TaxID=1470261 RepID=UPI00201D1679|nr:hypothetical protein [Streptomyces panaciradicis]MCL6669025.1 hypothetical protein [Streptomyces panaciradicis]
MDLAFPPTLRTSGALGLRPDAHRQVWIGEDADHLAVRRTDLKILRGLGALLRWT